MTARLLRASERDARPWKDGGGLTSEIAAFPSGAGMDDFGWRISTAIVGREGPFSLFPGIDRTLMILSGTLELRIVGEPPRTLTRADTPFAFAGDAACHGTPMGGPVQDLNVMVRRGRFAAEVRRVAGGAAAFGAGTICLVIAAEAARVTSGGVTHDLGPLDALLIEPRAQADELAIDGPVFLVSLTPSPDA